MSEVKVRQIGHLASNPEMTYVGLGEQKVARVRLVVMSNKRWTDQNTGEARGKTTAISWNLWRGQAENAMKYLRKGSHVSIEGRVENNNFEKDGETVYSFGFTCEDLEYLDSKAVADARAQGGGGQGLRNGEDVSDAGFGGWDDDVHGAGTSQSGAYAGTNA